MRRRILVTIMAVAAGAALIVACGKRDSLFIDPGKSEASPPKKSADKPPATPAAPPPKS